MLSVIECRTRVELIVGSLPNTGKCDDFLQKAKKITRGREMIDHSPPMTLRRKAVLNIDNPRFEEWLVKFILPNCS